jgi:lipid-A-disaccharide synthase
MAGPIVREVFEQVLAERASANLDLTLFDGRSTEVMAAADVVLLASGTATLEALLIKRPMVVCYRVSPVSAWIARRFRLMTTERFAMPNLLAREDLVPEIMQEAVSGESLGRAVLEQLQAPPAQRDHLLQTFEAIHHQLRQGASARAAEAVIGLLRAQGALPDA